MNLTITSHYLGRREDPPDPHAASSQYAPRPKPWEYFAFTVTLHYQGRTFDTAYKMGTGHARYVHRYQLPKGDPLRFAGGSLETYNGKPDPRVKLNHFGPGKDGYALPPVPGAADVLDNLVSDASSWVNARNFSDFCAELGYSDDSIKARAVFDACGEIYRQLRALLGVDVLEKLMTMDEDERRAWVEAES